MAPPLCFLSVMVGQWKTNGILQVWDEETKEIIIIFFSRSAV